MRSNGRTESPLDWFVFQLLNFLDEIGLVPALKSAIDFLFSSNKVGPVVAIAEFWKAATVHETRERVD
jgi:hypothetical protein